ncbi:MAG: hypothetical protein NTW50_02890 [Candidatus Berkelbacteria bacterium]|nr:hypothetical protein [Candidatus Berkelbacteria bacterium]
MKKLLKSKILWLIICQLAIIFVSVVNVFPRGYIFAGGDITQYYNLAHIAKGLHFTWSNFSGEGFFLQFFGYSLFYDVVYFLKSLFHISNSGQSFFYFFFFMTGSFWSFYLSSKLFLKDAHQSSFYRIGFALLYTFNFYVLNTFYFIWGYSPFLTLYTLIPAIFGLCYRYFSSEKMEWKSLFLLAIPFFLSNIANGNMAFFISLNIISIIFIVSLYLFSERKINFLFYLKKMVFYYAFYFLCVCWSVFPQIIELLRLATSFNSGGTIFDNKAWIIWQSISFPDIFFLVPHLADFISTKIFAGSALFLALIGVVIFSQAFAKAKMSKITLTFLILLVIGIFLENKGVGIVSNGLTIAIFNNTLLGALRSYDKVLVFFPFIIIILILIQFQSYKYRNYVIGVLAVLALSFSYPFFIGGIQKTFSNAYSDGGNYLTSKGTFIHNIPNEYFEAAAILNQKLTDSKLLTMPYSVLNSPGWVNYTKWNVTGVDPTTQLFNSPSVEMNGYGAFGSWNYGKLWGGQSASDSVWLFNLAGYLNTKYLIYHKDISQKFIAQTQGKMIDLEKDGHISKVIENDYFVVYKLADRFYLPHFYTPTQAIVSDLSIEHLPTILKGVNNSSRSAVILSSQNVGKDLSKIAQSPTGLPVLEYKKINPTKYHVVVHGSSDTFPMIFSEAFHGGWQVFLGDSSAVSKDSLGSRLQSYTAFSDNEDVQASKDDLTSYVNSGLVSNLGDGKSKELKSVVWKDGRDTTGETQKYTIDFISKNIQGTIQNNNLSDGSIFETWTKNPVVPESEHFIANGYANGWVVETNQICQNNSKCTKNSDGSYDLDLIISFKPQEYYYLSLWVSLGALLIAAFGLIFVCRSKFKSRVKNDVK